jgi:hypothetical protein
MRFKPVLLSGCLDKICIFLFSQLRDTRFIKAMRALHNYVRHNTVVTAWCCTQSVFSHSVTMLI